MKKKILFGIILIVIAIVSISLGVFLIDTLPNNTDYLTTIKDELIFGCGFMLCFVGAVGFIGGIGIIANALDVF